MGGPLSVDISGIGMTKLEKEVVYPLTPILFKRYIDDIFNRKKKNQEDNLLPKLNAYHPKIKFTVERNLTKFLDTKLTLEDGKYKTSVNRNRKLPTHWSSKIPKKIKRNVIRNDLHRAKKLCSNFNEGIQDIKQKYLHAKYPSRFIDSIVKDFTEKERTVQKSSSEDDEKPVVLIRVPYCEKNEKTGPHFLTKLRQFTNNKFNFRILWQSRKVKTLFKIKDDIKHKAKVIYKGTSNINPSISYIGETAQIAKQRWNQHEDPKHLSAPSKYLKEHENDTFTWEVLTTSSDNWRKRKIHEALFICKHRPVLNAQIEHKRLVLFRAGVT